MTIISGILVILALSLLTPYFYYIPKATLSAVIISAVIFMVEIGMILPIWRCNSEYTFEIINSRVLDDMRIYLKDVLKILSRDFLINIRKLSFRHFLKLLHNRLQRLL